MFFYWIKTYKGKKNISRNSKRKSITEIHDFTLSKFQIYLLLWSGNYINIWIKVHVHVHEYIGIDGHNRWWIDPDSIDRYFSLIFINVIDPSVKDFLFLIDSIDNWS